MAHYVDGGSKGFVAATALALGTIVKLNAAGAVLACTSAADVAIGTVTEAATAGRTVNVRLRNASGTSNVLLAGTVAVGAMIVSNGSGLGVAGTQAGAGAQPTSQVVGVAAEAGVSGQIIEMVNVDLLY